MSHRMVLCSGCDLVYVDSPPSQAALNTAYHKASYDSAEEADDAAKAYLRALKPTLSRLKRRESSLEVGAGNGAFLQHLQQAGFHAVIGVEPSIRAIEAAHAHIRPSIREGVFVEADFAPASLDLFCCFMTMEHVQDPKIVARSAMRLLRPGGAFVIVTHNYRSFVNRLAGRWSPIIDIEHMQLFSKRSLHHLFYSCEYQQIEIKSFKNTYSVSYWLRLLPIPKYLKDLILCLLSCIKLGKVKISLNVGNVMTIGFKPDDKN